MIKSSFRKVRFSREPASGATRVRLLHLDFLCHGIRSPSIQEQSSALLIVKPVQNVQAVSAKQFGADPSFGGQTVQIV